MAESPKTVTPIQTNIQPTNTLNFSNENPNSQITTCKLNGQNFLQWSQSAKLFLKSKRKMGYVLGRTSSPKEDDPMFETWEAENSMVMSWLLHSMQPEISKPLLFLSTAKEIWDAVTHSYSKVGVRALVYELKNQIYSTKQGSLSVTEYYNSLEGLWLELDHYQSFPMESAADAAQLHKMMEEDRIYAFLTGLRSDFDQVRVQILGKEPFPSLKEVFSYVREEESRRMVMLEKPSLENSALAIPKSGYSRIEKQEGRTSNEKDTRWCDFCKKPRHTRETCWKLHGKPSSNGKGEKLGPKKNQAFTVENNRDETFTSSQEFGGFNKAQLDTLKILLDQMTNSTPACSYVQQGPGNREDDWAC
ncbi:hypothetical protein UlMin_012738 [Ulmus minor]